LKIIAILYLNKAKKNTAYNRTNKLTKP